MLAYAPDRWQCRECVLSAAAWVSTAIRAARIKIVTASAFRVDRSRQARPTVKPTNVGLHP